MIWIAEIEYRMSYEDHRLLVLAEESPSQGLIASPYDNTFADPLPELSLRGPELLSCAADYQRRFFLFGLLFAH